MASTITRIYEGLQFANDFKLTYSTYRLAKMLAEKIILRICITE